MGGSSCTFEARTRCFFHRLGLATKRPTCQDRRGLPAVEPTAEVQARTDQVLYLRLHALVTTAVLLLLAGCIGLPLEVAQVPSEAFPHPEQTSLGRAFASELMARPGKSGVYVLDVGTDAFLARAALADATERSLDLQYYSMRSGRTTQELVARLAAAATRGVRVRLLLDGLDAAGRNREIGALAAHPNIEVRLFNPFRRQSGAALWRLAEFASDGERLNRRMHNKLWIADGATAIVGGRNLGDEYFDGRDRKSVV